jgi:SpoU rRNA methylase family enzyme
MTIDMNKITRNFMNIAFLMFFTALTVGATDGIPSITMEAVTNQKKVAVQIENLNIAATLEVLDAEGMVLIKRKVSATDNFQQLFAVDALPAGEYRIVITTPTAETVQPFEVTKDAVELKDWKRKVYYAPTVRKVDQYFDVNWMNGRLGDLTVSIINEDGELVFKDIIANVFKVEKRYHTDKLDKGAYTLQLKTAHKTYYETLTVQ